MIAGWLGAAALASAPGMLCENGYPIGGTAGQINGLDAVRTNATTYSAGEFAKRRMLADTSLVMDFHYVAGAASVPSWCEDTEGAIAQALYAAPLDLHATNFGMRVGNPTISAFYAGSVTGSTSGIRVLSWSVPVFDLYPAVFAPVIGDYDAGGGLTNYRVDWIGGAQLRTDYVSVQAGYTGSRGLYFDVTQDRVGVFFNSVLQGDFTWKEAAYVLTGAQGFDPAALVGAPDEVGVTSLFYRQFDDPSSGAVTDGAAAARVLPTGIAAKLRTGHLRQEDLFGVADVRAAWQFGEASRLRELAVAAHTRGWVLRRDKPLDEEWQGYVRLGLMNLPDAPLLNVQGGVKPTVRADFHRTVGSDRLAMQLHLSARMNDPDVLDLYPFAYNALGVNSEITIFSPAGRE
jgi:hypothetical protein